MPESKTIVVSIMSPGVGKGAGGFVIVNGKLKRIPPHSPKLKAVAAALNVIAHAEEISDRKIRTQVNEAAESLVASSVGGLIEEAEK